MSGRRPTICNRNVQATVRRLVPLLIAAGVAVCAIPAAAEDGAPHTGLIKHAIFTRIYGKPTIPHIMKFVAAPSAVPVQTAVLQKPRLAGATTSGVLPEPVPAASQSVTVSPASFHRTYSYHYPYYFGTVAGSYPPAYFASYPGYYGGFVPPYSGFGYGGVYRAGYYGATPYYSTRPYYGVNTGWYGYRPWGYGSYGLPYYSSTYGPVYYGMPGYGYGPGYGYSQRGYIGSYYW